MVLLLFDSPAGHALFKVLDEGKLKEAETKVGKKGRWLIPVGEIRLVCPDCRNAGGCLTMHSFV